MISRPLTVMIGLSALFAGCYDDIVIDEHCPPASEGCGAYDYDGDGVANDDDDFPSDGACAMRDDDNCSACGVGCLAPQVCDGQGGCVCPDARFMGTNCDECTDPKYTGANCDECADPTYTGESCDECSDLTYTGENCDECANPAFMGPACDICKNPVSEQSGCDDGNPCTQDSCEAAVGCSYLPLDGATCDDASLCTLDDLCVADVCHGQPLTCDDGNMCTDDDCDPLTGCTYVSSTDGTACDDGDLCSNGDVCVSGECIGVALYCDDSNTCTADSCDEQTGACVYAPLTAECDDADLCTFGDHCGADGTCAGVAVDCSGVSDPCLQTSCNPASGSCDLPVTDGTPCVDTDLCNGAETCQAGTCVPGSMLDCSDDNACNGVEVCDPLTGCGPAPTGNLPDATPCNDGNACTAGEVCQGGMCGFGATVECDDGAYCNGTEFCLPALGCQAGSPPSVDDAIPCTTDACDEGSDTMTHTPSDAACDDANACTDDTCSTVSGCQHQPTTGGACNDGDACTTSDGCLNGQCLGDSVSCDDLEPCTVDSCSPTSGACQNVSICAGDQFCTENQACFGPKTTLATVSSSGYADSAFALAGQYVEYTDGEDVMRVSASGGVPVKLWENTICSALEMTLSVNGSTYIGTYCSFPGLAALIKLPSGGTGEGTIVASADSSWSLDGLQTDGSNFFWTDGGAIVVSSVGSPVCDPDSLYLECADDVLVQQSGVAAFVLASGYAYISANYPARLLRVSTSGGSVTTLKEASSSDTIYGGLAVHAAYLYFFSKGKTDSGSQSSQVNRCSTTGTGCVVLDQGNVWSGIGSSGAPYGSIVADDTGVYWNSNVSSDLMYYPSDAGYAGSAMFITSTGGTGPHFMLIDEWGIYWRTGSAIYRLAR